MVKYFIFWLGVITLVNCKPKDNTYDEPKLSVGCYGYTHANSKITFQITRVDPLVQGTLIYDWAEKDRNAGSFNGSFKDSILIGTYTFISEGIESSREVAFKVKDSTLYEGNGAMQTVGKMASYSNIDQVSFDTPIKLKKGACIN